MKTEQEIRARICRYDSEIVADEHEDGSFLSSSEWLSLAVRIQELRWVLGEE